MTKHEAERYNRICQILHDLGLDQTEIDSLRRAEKTLSRWSEGECGDGNDYCSWAIERDENGEGKPFMVIHYNNSNKVTRTSIPDREARALKRVKKITEAHGLSYYHQTDPRGCGLYIIRPGDVKEGQDVNACYTNGLAISV